mmetsp:Transcript_27187/g.69213  ORF Transcript_27187/g.69213 Transcript_27187/m.69213 type:complete len:290 (+) Transcript_27187:2522-3391(+)
MCPCLQRNNPANGPEQLQHARLAGCLSGSACRTAAATGQGDLRQQLLRHVRHARDGRHQAVLVAGRTRPCSRRVLVLTLQRGGPQRSHRRHVIAHAAAAHPRGPLLAAAALCTCVWCARRHHLQHRVRPQAQLSQQAARSHVGHHLAPLRHAALAARASSRLHCCRVGATLARVAPPVLRVRQLSNDRRRVKRHGQRGQQAGTQPARGRHEAQHHCQAAAHTPACEGHAATWVLRLKVDQRGQQARVQRARLRRHLARYARAQRIALKRHQPRIAAAPHPRAHRRLQHG